MVVWEAIEKQHRLSFNPWTLSDTPDGTCLYLNVSTKVLQPVDCKKQLCSVCELDQERLIFRLRSQCQGSWNLNDGGYILSDLQNGNFLGTSGYSKIKYGKVLMSTNTYEETQLAELRTDRSNESFGIHTWNVWLCGDLSTSPLKLTNVSAS